MTCLSATRLPAAPTLAQLADALEQGHTTSRSLVEECLANIARPDGEGSRTFVHIDAAAVCTAADAADDARRAGRLPSRFAGIPVSVKDAFDVEGQVTTAGSRVLRDHAPATQDAPAVAKLKQAGMIVMGRTNMTEFAYSGLGMNPHHGTPLNPWNRHDGHVPGGSSSGAAVSVADGMAHAALGTDTGGSCRIPAAFTGLVGYKPSRDPLLMQGAVPLAPSLDTAGYLARSVACCAALAWQARPLHSRFPAGTARPAFAVPQTLVLDKLDKPVASAFEKTLALIAGAGCQLREVQLPEFGLMPAINAKGGLPAAESFHWHRTLLETGGHLYDPQVRRRIMRGATQSAADYLDLLEARDAMVAAAGRALRQCDALLMPTVAIAPPRLADMDDDDAHQSANALALRNTALINFFDGCAISIPMHEPGETPAGLMLASRNGDDARLLELAAIVEEILSRHQPRPS